MSGDVRYPGWCCRQIAAQLNQALFTMADLHAQVSDLREENRQLKMKMESFDVRRAQEDDRMRCSGSITSTTAPALAIEMEKNGSLKPTSSETFRKLDQEEKSKHDGSNAPCPPGSLTFLQDTNQGGLTPNIPPKTISGSGSGESSIGSAPELKQDFKCDRCDSSFPNSDLLTIHQAVHIGRSFHVCKVCNAMFLLKADLSRHWATHPNIKQHVCQLCGKAYTSKNNYKLHIKTHTGVGLYPCEVCGKAFHSENHLNVHRRIHTGERPFECQYCDKSFTQKSGLINHTRLHTGEKPFLCPSCPKAFTQKSNLNFHLSKHHPPSSEIQP